MPDPGRTERTLYWKMRAHVTTGSLGGTGRAPSHIQGFLPGTHRGHDPPTFWMSVMSTSLMTLFLLEEPDLELSKHK